MSMDMQALIAAVRQHAVDNYTTGGWDYVVECWEDDEIQVEIEKAGATTATAAIKTIGDIIQHLDEYRREVQCTAW
jgi:hypothetical protein